MGIGKKERVLVGLMGVLALVLLYLSDGVMGKGHELGQYLFNAFLGMAAVVCLAGAVFGRSVHDGWRDSAE